jgi:hypothetical protein
MQQRALRRARLSTATLLVATAATLAMLRTLRPHLVGPPTAWSGDDLAFAVAWLAAVACSAWLLLTTLVCLAALARGRRRVADRVARWAPPIARRILQAALVGTWVVVPTVAYAAPAAPLVVRVGASGRLVTLPGAAAASNAAADAPVVRAPRSPFPAAVASTRSGPTPRAGPGLSSPVQRAPSPAKRAPAAPQVRDRRHLVRAGDNLWRIARDEVRRASRNPRPDSGAVARYWQRVVAANRATLRSGDPSLIYAGELVTLPD